MSHSCYPVEQREIEYFLPYMLERFNLINNALIYSQFKIVNPNFWFVTICTLFAVIAVYELNREFKSVNREIKNGLINPAAYIAVKSLLVLPIMFVFAVCGISNTPNMKHQNTQPFHSICQNF